MPSSESQRAEPAFGPELMLTVMPRWIRRAMTSVAWARELVMFVSFGATAALTTLSVGRVLYGDRLPIHLPYWCATGIAATVGLVVNFTLNYSFNFKFRDRSASQQFSTFCLVAGIGILLTSLLSETFLYAIERFAAGSFQLGDLAVRTKLAAHVLAVGAVALYSFPAHRLISFNIGIGARLRQVQLAIIGCRE
jgi:putative flippase GtrA